MPSIVLVYFIMNIISCMYTYLYRLIIFFLANFRGWTRGGGGGGGGGCLNVVVIVVVGVVGVV